MASSRPAVAKRFAGHVPEMHIQPRVDRIERRKTWAAITQDLQELTFAIGICGRGEADSPNNRSGKNSGSPKPAEVCDHDVPSDEDTILLPDRDWSEAFFLKSIDPRFQDQGANSPVQIAIGGSGNAKECTTPGLPLHCDDSFVPGITNNTMNAFGA
ncbi:hypothetical protein MSTE_02041 [Mycobacteroides stephanolepidis]|uniref:Uncharacterized protein n=1 Tax=[Mycobacterium] stephanolepidis TaxID=1520670 RepID=A0A1Z4EWJ9_9MYCO|nr:hypothetical protein MSTE_02041 [[Mycobacterium] stephanolepidis]